MQRTERSSSNTQSSNAPSANAPHTKQPLSARQVDWRRRIKAAGLEGDGPESRDEARGWLARSINMFTNTWRGCPEALCRRYRGCMAPNIDCTNAKPIPEMSPQEEQKIFAKFFDDLSAAIERWEAEQEAETAATATSARRTG